MEPTVVKEDLSGEHLTPEGCYILENWNSTEDGMSIARARVEPGVTTQRHILAGVDEKYLIVSGTGSIEVGDLPATEVATGDLVVIPAGTPQRIINAGEEDLIFYCICMPGFTPDCYLASE